ncbi:hypothetical protein ACHAW6_011883 [Cyclotella cf. meneghiniana]
MAPTITNSNLLDRRGTRQRFSKGTVVRVAAAVFILALALETKIFIINSQTHPPPQTKHRGVPKGYLDDRDKSPAVTNSWCERVKKARSTLNEKLHVRVPCKTMEQAKSAVVVYITAGVPEEKATKTVFSGKDYIDGVMALGASLNDHLTTKETHRLLLLRDDFMSSLPEEILEKLKKIGWIIGIAPLVDIDDKYVPRFARYKTVYTKISVLGLAEYECVLLLDADTLVVGNIDELMTCNILKPSFRAAGGLDLYHGQWRHFNTGSVLWRPGSDEMNRIYSLTADPTFMKRFESDQIFTNTVYPYRNNITINNQLMAGEQVNPEHLGSIAHLPWEYNAQTHLEYQRPEFWDEHVTKLKIIHFTQKKGWQCQKRLDEPPPLSSSRPAAKDCTLQTDCACHEGYKWYQYLKKAEDFASLN